MPTIEEFVEDLYENYVIGAGIDKSALYEIVPWNWKAPPTENHDAEWKDYVEREDERSERLHAYIDDHNFHNFRSVFCERAEKLLNDLVEEHVEVLRKAINNNEVMTQAEVDLECERETEEWRRNVSMKFKFQ
jgi:NAD(P)H-nitrite reductase large subunit